MHAESSTNPKQKDAKCERRLQRYSRNIDDPRMLWENKENGSSVCTCVPYRNWRSIACSDSSVCDGINQNLILFSFLQPAKCITLSLLPPSPLCKAMQTCEKLRRYQSATAAAYSWVVELCSMWDWLDLLTTCSVPQGMLRFTFAKLLSPWPVVLPTVPRPAVIQDLSFQRWTNLWTR